jgi:hypothetical protein
VRVFNASRNGTAGSRRIPCCRSPTTTCRSWSIR